MGEGPLSSHARSNHTTNINLTEHKLYKILSSQRGLTITESVVTTSTNIVNTNNKIVNTHYVIICK